MNQDITIRAMSRAELDVATDWAAAEGWNPGLADADAFLATDPGGFLMAFVGDRPAACISVVAYANSFGFLGFYIATPEFRGRGIGWQLWQAGMGRLAGRTVGLDGVVAQQDNYRKSGFALAHRNVRYAGVARADMPQDPRLARIGQGILPSVVAYDRAFFPVPRDGFVGRWTRDGGRTGWCLVEDGEVRGYGVIRKARQGYKIGPLFADDPRDADLLFRALASGVKGEEIALDPPEPNDEAIALAERHDLSPVFETARMYRGADPGLPLDRIFGITTFELG
ncbi:GNAT family N-acetyltransferase [uncultured Alsobacter sp.]|uniref:GNAT family N-acetyltransferase n=1 Tax=uncultured Alsobacter sp. TaxID=1748258 RepID=UPI0025E6C695|nr:GNAT family N-acetyltransferase [uncultured Alsobacter sp.]